MEIIMKIHGFIVEIIMEIIMEIIFVVGNNCGMTLI
jgi:hypothetical protein